MPWWADVMASWYSAGVRFWRQVWKFWRSLRFGLGVGVRRSRRGIRGGCIQVLDDVGVGLGEVVYFLGIVFQIE